MSVATEPHPRSIFTWATLEHAKPVNGSCSGESNTTSSSSVMPASTSSSGKSSNDPLPSPALSDTHSTTWTTGTFSFPPCSSRTMRSLPVPPQKSAPSTSASTSRVINALPGFDDFAELVMASERRAPSVTVTPTPSQATPAPAPATSKIRRIRFHSQRATPSEPKPIMSTPQTTTSSLPWTKSDDGDGRVTFIFGRLKPARVRYSAPPQTAQSSLNPASTTTTIFSRNPSPIPAPPVEPAESRPVALPQVSP